MSELNVALVGCGGAGGVHLRCWSQLSGVRIAALCDTDGVRVAQTALQVPGAGAFTDIKTLLTAGPFDIVDVCTPRAAQFDIVRAALQAGAHVLCETPFTSHQEQAQALVELAETRERLLMPGFCHRFHPPILFVRELLENDELGRPTMFRCRFSGYWDEAAESETTRFDGALRATAIHALDLFRYLVGEVKEITGKLRTANPNLNVEDTVALLLESTQGALGVIETSWSSPGGRNVLEIYGTAGACLVDYDTGALRYLTADQPVWRHHDEGGPNRFEREIAHFADAVRGLQSLVVTAADGAIAAGWCDQIYKQA